MDDSLIAIPVFIVLVGFPVTGWILARVMKHRERMAMLRMGIVPPNDMRKYRRNGYTGPDPWLGMPPQPGAPMPGYSAYDDQNTAQYSLQKGVRTTMVGLALTIGFSFIGYHANEFPPIHPGPWLLGGLIPMFVGIAQIINSLLAGATFTMRRPMGPPLDTPQPPPPPPQPGRPFSGFSEPGAPGPRYEELARPVPPPDRPKNN
jgi:hypothetical protein